MIVNGDKTTHCFEKRVGERIKRIHFARAYLSDICDKVRPALELLSKHKVLSLGKISEETTAQRTEYFREIFQLLWELKDFGVDVINGKNIKNAYFAFVENSQLDKVLDLSDEALKELILEKLKRYPPFIAVLEKYIDYKDRDECCTQVNITGDLNLTDSSGNSDNVPPMCRIANDDEGFGLVTKHYGGKNNCGRINDLGIQYVNEANKNKVHLVEYNIDLNKSPEDNTLTHILTKLSKGEIISFDEIYNKIKDVDLIVIDENEIPTLLMNLKQIGLPITIIEDTVKINEEIVHHITMKDYVKFGLDQVDKITKPNNEEDDVKDEKEIILQQDAKILIITDDPIVLENYPTNIQKLTYEQFLEIEAELPNSNINTIIIPSRWKGKKTERIAGTLTAFARFGGNLVIENINVPGRSGANSNRYGFLPHDIHKIQSSPNADTNSPEKGFFTFNAPECFTYTTKLPDSEEIAPGRYSYLSLSYNSGKIIFVTIKNYKNKLDNLVSGTSKITIDENSVAWKYRTVPSLRLQPGVNTEYDLYPPLREIFNNTLSLEFDPNITGKPGQTDLMVYHPFFCCCEVTPSGTSCTGGEKVGEVERHRMGSIGKDTKAKKANKTPPYGGGKIGACVIGVQFSNEEGDDKHGAIDSADAQRVALIRYQDIYELICLNEKHPLTDDELKKIFFFQEGESPEAAVRIYDLIQQKQ